MFAIQQCRPGLGTYVEIALHGPGPEDVLLGASALAFAEIERIQRLMSFHDPASELSRINRTAHLEACAISEDLATVLRCALRLSELTNGRFDVSIAPELVRRGALPEVSPLPPKDSEASWLDIDLKERLVRFRRPLQIDLGGIAKGYAVDRALAVIDPEIEVTVNAGGDLAMRPWRGERVQLKMPGFWRPRLWETAMEAPAVATSASYYLDGRAAIILPHARKAHRSHRSVSVFAPSCMIADALTKVVHLMPGCESILVQYEASAIIGNPWGRIERLGA